MFRVRNILHLKSLRPIHASNTAHESSAASIDLLNKNTSTNKNRKLNYIERHGLYKPTHNSKIVILDDIETLIFMSKTKAELDTVIEKIKEIDNAVGRERLTQTLINSLDLHTDMALELFNDVKFQGNFNKQSVLKLMKKLLEKQRNEDVIKVFYGFMNEYEKRRSEQNPLPSDGQFIIPTSHLNLLATALIRINSITSYEIMNQILVIGKENIHSLDQNIIMEYLDQSLTLNKSASVLNFLFIYPLLKSQPNFVHNLKALAFLKLNRVENAIYEINSILGLYKRKQISGIVFQSTIKTLKSINSSKNEKLNDLLKRIEESECLGSTDFNDFFLNDKGKMNKPAKGKKK